MKVVIDAMGAPDNSGGMQVHADEFVTAWATQHSDDTLEVVGYSWLEERFSSLANVTVQVNPDAGTLRRFLTQVLIVPRVARASSAEVVISLSTIVTPMRASRTVTACFIHDWRHLGSPEDFSWTQRMLRRLWKVSIRRADVTFAISRKTLRETREVARPRKLVLAENGGDHPSRWQRRVGTANDVPTILTFGHLASKRPELVLEALSELAAMNFAAQVIVVGTRGSRHDDLEQLARSLGLGERVTFPGFVPDERLRQLMQQADLVALMSSDEGYGLPVAEAHYFGKPVIVASDSGLEEVHGRRVSAVTPIASAVANAIIEALEPSGRREEVPVVRWEETVRVVRNAMRNSLAAEMSR